MLDGLLWESSKVHQGEDGWFQYVSITSIRIIGLLRPFVGVWPFCGCPAVGTLSRFKFLNMHNIIQTNHAVPKRDLQNGTSSKHVLSANSCILVQPSGFGRGAVWSNKVNLPVADRREKQLTEQFDGPSPINL